jgi:hypothetical protein
VWGGKVPRAFKREAGLADPAWPDQRQQTATRIGEQSSKFSKFLSPTNERSELMGQMMDFLH